MWPQAMDGTKIFLGILKRLKWPLILGFYMILLQWEPLWSSILLTAFFAAGYLAYLKDVERESVADDDFSGGGLFYRYGQKVSGAAWPIPVPEDLGVANLPAFADSLRHKLATRITAELPSDDVQILEPVLIRNKSSWKQKAFTRVLARSPIGSRVVHFVHFAAFGKTMTLHLDSFVRGSHTQLDALKFTLETPLTIWSWGWRWLMNELSILSQISRFEIDSFDDMDVDTIYISTYALVLSAIGAQLEEEGLLTPELSQMIHQNVYNVQSFSVSNSAGVTIGAASQSVTASVAKASKAAA